MKAKWQRIWNVMANGVTVNLHGITYAVVCDRFCYKMSIYRNPTQSFNLALEPDEIHYLESDLPLNMFINECETMSETEISSYERECKQ